MITPFMVLFFGFWLVIFLVVAFFIYSWFSWNIPVVILRYQGDKRRPQIVVTKARRHNHAGITRLFVKGYKMPFRDFKSKYYYPAKKGKNGALVLWEYKNNMLTPTIPKKIKGLTKKQYETVLAEYRRYYEALTNKVIKPVEWEHDENLYNDLLLNAIDDTDIEFMLQQFSRVNSQYVTGWRDFLGKYGGHVVLVMIAICALVGFVVYLEKAPSIAGQCLQVAEEQSRNILREMGSSLTTGSPPI